ncbi:MAG: lipase family protein [Planctomycetota bacterium]
MSYQAFQTNRGHSWINSCICAELSRLIYLSQLFTKAQLKTRHPSVTQVQARLQTRLAERRYGVARAQVRYGEAKTRTGDTEFAVVGLDAAVLVVFRGTEAGDFNSFTKDWIYTNANFGLKRYSNFGQRAKLHGGFLCAANDSFPQVRRMVREVMGRDFRPIYCCGHSLGGAVATVTALRLLRQAGQDVRGLYTYGMPRVGNAAFAGLVNNDIAEKHRWVNRCDPVPNVPLNSLGYIHWGGSTYRRIESPSRVVLRSQKQLSGFETERHAIAEYQDIIMDRMPLDDRRALLAHD